jgi:hypothetical protein
MEPLSWQYLLFEIPLAAGILLTIGNACGLSGDSDVEADADVEADVEVDVDGDLDADVDADHDFDATHAHGGSALEASAAQWRSLPFRLMKFLGAGKVPFTLLLTMGFVIFGLSGLMANEFLRRTVRFAIIYGWVSLAFAGFVALVLTGRLARLFNRFLPSSVTFVTRKRDLISAQGTAETRITDTFGMANVRDTNPKGGDLHQIKCICREGTIPPREPVLVVDRDEQAGVFIVVPLPPELRK